MTLKKHKSRSTWQEKITSWAKSIKEWFLEILLACLVLTLVIWFFIPKQYNNLFLSGLQEIMVLIGTFLGNLLELLATTKIIVSLFLVALIGGLFTLRIRYHIKRKAIITKHCPVCENEVYRQHRKPIHHFLNLFVPVRHYKCKSCGWEGLRIFRRSSKKNKTKQ